MVRATTRAVHWAVVRGALGLALGAGIAGCSPNQKNAESANVEASKGTDGGSNSGVSIRLETADWTRVKTRFSILSTIAGKGSLDNGNDWAPSFEGGSATAAELSRPHMALTDASGNLYIADKESHAIRKVTPDGTIHTVAGTNASGNAPDAATPALEGALSSPNGLWVNPDGTFYIVDLGNAKVRRVTPQGQMSTLFAMASLSVGRGLWVAEDESEALVASGSELLAWTPSGGVRTLASGFGGLGMVLKTKTGRILAGDREGLRVYEVTPDGKRTVIAGNGTSDTFVDGGRATETAFNEPRAIWPYGEGLLVGLHDGCRIIYIDNEGYSHLMLRGSKKSHAGDGEPYDATRATIGEVRSITVDASGNLIFVENDTGVVRRLTAASP